MHKLVLAILSASFLMMQPASVRADVKLDVRVGFPTAVGESKFKVGLWTPVMVDVLNETDATLPAGCVLIVEAPDSDDLPGQLMRRLDNDIAPGNRESIQSYIRLGNAASEVNVSLRAPGKDGKDLKEVAKAKAQRSSYTDAMQTGSTVYLALGSPLAELKKYLDNLRQQKGAARGESYELLSLVSVPDLPDRWYGYQGINVVVLTTGRQAFVDELLAETGGKKKALTEWVRRGGRLVVTLSPGKNLPQTVELVKRLDLLPVDVQPLPARTTRLDSVQKWASAGSPGTTAGRLGFVSSVEGNPIEVANFEVRPGPAQLVDALATQQLDLAATPGTPARSQDRPVILSGPCGLGRVLLVAFDLDAAPFNEWSNRDKFWERIHKTVSTGAEAEQNFAKNNFGAYDYSDPLAQMQRGLETFEEVPVISFGWVALFILLYIGVVGPLDYWFLKKVVKRLELTWVTFPAVVLVISIAAYFTAYKLKGSDLRINKVDVVDYTALPDADGNQVTAVEANGNTWVTLFSPHIKHYTLGLDPVTAGWAPRAKTGEANPAGMIVDTMLRPDSFYGVRSTGSGSLFRRNFEYHPEAGGLSGVAVQVWSTKNFSASWHTSLPREEPVFTAQLRRKGEDKLTGTVKHNLPVALEDAVLFFGKSYFQLGTLEPGEPTSPDGRNFQTYPAWFNEAYPSAVTHQATAKSNVYNREFVQTTAGVIKGVLFHTASASGSTPPPNSVLYPLDQTWRLLDQERSKREAILVARVKPLSGKAQEVAQANGSPTRLWLDALPGAGPQPEVIGKLSQETYVRVYLPILK